MKRYNYVKEIIYCIGSRDNPVTKEKILEMLHKSEKQKEVNPSK